MNMERLYEVKPIVLGKIWRDGGALHYLTFYGQQGWLPVTMWYIKGADMPILVDTGGPAKEFPKYNPMPAEDIISFENALAAEDLRAEDIGLVICTHLHYDHVLNIRKCINARMVVQKTELDFAQSPHPLFAHLYDTTMAQELPFETVEGDVELVAGIKLHHFGGHTPGSQGVEVRTHQGQAVISGICTTQKNFDPPQGVAHTPFLACGIHVDPIQSYEAIVKIKGMADRIFPNHDTRLLEGMK